MIELTVVRGPSKGTSIALTPDRSVTIGISAEAELRVGGDGIASEHIVVKALKGGGFGAKGIGGTFAINGRDVEAARLRDGDVLAVGDSELRYLEKGAAEAVPELAGFRLLGVLGRGGWGTVYRAEQVSLGREVALKVLSRERLDDPMFVGRFQAEARAAARLHHPNVVQVFDVDHDGDRWFYSMELMQGGSLEQRLKREGRLPVEDAIGAIQDAAKGLAFAEQMRVVHRDIKPDNLMVDRHGHVKIADLGLAMADDGAEDSKLVGTPHFMSPEQVRKQPLDHRSDLYALGCTFYRLVTGRTPFPRETVKQILRAQLEETATPAHEVEPSVPPAVGEVIARLMEKDPDARPQSASELIEELDVLLAPPVKRSTWVVASAAATVLIALVVLVVVLNRPEPQNGGTKEILVESPEARAAMAENRRIQAENALLRVKAGNLEGLALATALEEMASAHEDTAAAKQARAEATRLREAERERLAAEAARRARIERAVESLRETFQRALSSGDLPAAAAVLAGGYDDAEIGDAPAVAEARAELEQQLKAAAKDRLTTLVAAVDAAVEQRDPTAIRAALEPISAIAGPEGWPEVLVEDRAKLVAYVAERRDRASEIEAELAEAAQAEAWSALRAAALGDGGAAAAIAALDFDTAADRLARVGEEFGDFHAGARARGVAPALRAAKRYLERFRTAAATGTLEVADPRTGESVVIAGFDPAGGLTVKSGSRVRPKTETLPLAEVLRMPAAWFPPLPDAPESERAVFLGALALGQHLTAAQDYLARIQPADDASGTGATGFDAPDVPWQRIADAVATADDEWADAFATELRATALLGRSLTTLSQRRNLTAASLLERLLQEHAGTLVVRCLR